MSVDTDIVLDEKIKVRIDEPKMHKVIFLNDDTTPMEFVVNILTNVLNTQKKQQQK